MESLKFIDAAERVLVTFVQAALAFLIATPFDEFGTIGFWEGFALTVVIAAANGVKMLLTLWVPLIDNAWLDGAYRAVSTFLVVLAGYAAGAEWLDIVSYDWWASVVFAALTATLAVVKAAIANAAIPNTLTPASFAKAA